MLAPPLYIIEMRAGAYLTPITTREKKKGAGRSLGICGSKKFPKNKKGAV
jgi:hypothetical protein